MFDDAMCALSCFPSIFFIQSDVLQSFSFIMPAIHLRQPKTIRGALFEEQAAVAALKEQTERFVESAIDINSLVAESTTCDLTSFGACLLTSGNYGTVSSCGACLCVENEKLERKREVPTEAEVCESIDGCFGDKCPDECKPSFMSYLNCEFEAAEVDGEISCP